MRTWGPPSPPRLCPRALTPDPTDKPGEGTERSQQAISPPRSSPAQDVASKLPDHLQCLVLTGVRLDPAAWDHSTPPTEKTGLASFPHRRPHSLRPGCWPRGQGGWGWPWGQGGGCGSAPAAVSLGVSAQAPPHAALTPCAHVCAFCNVLHSSYRMGADKHGQECRDLTPSQRVLLLTMAGDLTWPFLPRRGQVQGPHQIGMPCPEPLSPAETISGFQLRNPQGLT